MKISVITLHTIKNYGSVLQTYATQKKFEQMGAQVEFVDYWRADTLDKNLVSVFLSLSKRWSKNAVTRLVFRAIEYPSVRKGIRVFNGFLRCYIHLTSQRYFSFEELRRNPPQADVYCTGSDQVWNSDWNGGIEEPYFLGYAPAGKKCFAYSASFGKETLDPSERKITKPLLQKYNAISMREASGVRILKQMGIRTGVQILDPTLVLRKTDWEELIPQRKVRQEYILVYQLNKSRTFDDYARRLAKQKHCRLVRLSGAYHDVVRPGRLICCPDVEKWLFFFYHAAFILTDSFHGTAFSINFNRQFAVFYPPKFSTRLESLLDLTNLKSRVVTDLSDFSFLEKPIDYKAVNHILEAEREKADRFLTDALSK